MFPPICELLESRCHLSAGDLDTTFGTGGTRSIYVPANSQLNLLAIQPDGRVLVGGSLAYRISPGEDDYFEKTGLLVQRFMANGAVDGSYGQKGKAAIYFGDQDTGDTLYTTRFDPTALLPRSDGKLMVAGTLDDWNFRYWSVQRLSYNGRLDPMPSSLRIDTGDQNANMAAGVLRPDGGVVVAGNLHDGMHFFYNCIGFGSVSPTGTASLDGSVYLGRTDQITSPDQTRLNAMVRDASGRILFTGYNRIGTATDNDRFILGRLGDSSFATDGVFQSTAAHHGDAIIVQASGRIVVATDKGMRRFWPSGKRDTAFAGTRAGTFLATRLIRQPDGKILALGSGKLARFNAQGGFDTTFGNGGQITLRAGAQEFALAPDGDIITLSHARTHAILTRYQGDNQRPAAAASPQAVPTFSTRPVRELASVFSGPDEDPLLGNVLTQ